MQAKDLAKILKDYRAKNELSQGALAVRLEFTQATISRIESGKQLPRKGQVKKILDLVNSGNEEDPVTIESRALDADKKVLFLEDYFTYQKSDWSCFCASRPVGATGGDILLVRDLKKNSQVGVLVGDSVGHGTSSTYMSFALEFAYTAIASMFNPHLLSPELFDKAIATGVVKTSKNWRGEPSIIILQLDLEKSQVSFVNRGMPFPILLDGDKTKLLTERRASAFGLQSVVSASLSFNQGLGPGQSVFLYSDGLLDLIPESSLLQTMQRITKLFKGDSRAIGRNLIRYIEKNPQNKIVSDDVSFLIISRAMKRNK